MLTIYQNEEVTYAEVSILKNQRKLYICRLF